MSSRMCVPSLGVGTFKVKERDVIRRMLREAALSGYQLIDTASVYQNEQHIGVAIKELNASHLLITTKLGPKDHGYSRAMEALERSLSLLQMESVYLYLIHWPGAQGLPREDPRNKELRKESWVAMETLYRREKAKYIGVSNYEVDHLEELLEYAQVQPSVLQSEFHPLLNQRDLLKYCLENGIQFQAYSSLGNGELLTNSVVTEVAALCQRTPSQVLLRWALQHNVAVIPKSCKAEHIRENANIFNFTLSEEEMLKMNSLHCSKRYCWDPILVK